MIRKTSPVVLACAALLSGCVTSTLPSSMAHVSEQPRATGTIPEVTQAAPLPAPKAAPQVQTYSVSVTGVPVQSVLFALARDAGMNVDIHPGIQGDVTLNAIDQTLNQLLHRISRQVDMRYRVENGTLVVERDTPEWRNYKVDYVNMARTTNSSINIATQISTTGGGPQQTSYSSPSSQGGQQTIQSPSNPVASSTSGNNNSTTEVINRSENNFWANLERNVRDMLRDSTLNDPLTAINARVAPTSTQQAGGMQSSTGGQAGGAGQQPGTFQPAAPPLQTTPPENVIAAFGGASGTGADRERNLSSVIINPESGLLTVRATGRQHEKIQEFLDLVLSSARRQVLIEATVIEVRLSDDYQQGINWTRLGSGGLNLTQGRIGTLPSGVALGSTPGIFTLNYLNPDSALGNISTAVQLLESFGKVKVLSSPKISVLNNQTAMLKVVDNNVFFTIRVTPAVIGTNGVIATPATYESRLETVPVGFVMSVTPQIADTDEVTLNVRPTITRVVGFEQDPNPALAAENVVSRVPVIQAREVESVLKVFSGDIAMLGGLMQDSADNTRDGIPLVSRVPLIGNLFSYRNETSSKTELVIFIRPVVVKSASVNGDYRNYRYLLPNGERINQHPYSDPASDPRGAKGQTP